MRGRQMAFACGMGIHDPQQPLTVRGEEQAEARQTRPHGHTAARGRDRPAHRGRRGQAPAHAHTPPPLHCKPGSPRHGRHAHRGHHARPGRARRCACAGMSAGMGVGGGAGGWVWLGGNWPMCRMHGSSDLLQATMPPTSSTRHCRRSLCRTPQPSPPSGRRTSVQSSAVGCSPRSRASNASWPHRSLLDGSHSLPRSLAGQGSSGGGGREWVSR